MPTDPDGFMFMRSRFARHPSLKAGAWGPDAMPPPLGGGRETHQWRTTYPNLASRQPISHQVKWCIRPRPTGPLDRAQEETNQLSHQADYSILDLPEILQFIFYPRRDWAPPPPGASDFLVPVEEGVSISCRFYPAEVGSPCILYFHGNGEVACEHDWIAQLYGREGISLFVADYRGNGRSEGGATFPAGA